MEVRIGVVHTPKELTLELDASLDDVKKSIEKALSDDGVLWLVDPTGEERGARAPKTVRRHCAHEVAFVVLTGLAERFAGSSDEVRARRLRDRLDVFSS